MRIRVADSAAVDQLIEFLDTRGCIAERVSAHELDVFCLSSTRHTEIGLELDLYLELWNAVHPEAEAHIVAALEP
jgi:hypothetical protein